MKLKPGVEADYLKYKAINADDPYSNRVVTYGDEWANLMEAEIAKGRSVKDCAKETSHTADTDGITGFMYGAAVSALSQFWQHGDELRAWHNREYLSDEEAAEADKTGGTVNPAILTIKG